MISATKSRSITFAVVLVAGAIVFASAGCGATNGTQQSAGQTAMKAPTAPRTLPATMTAANLPQPLKAETGATLGLPVSADGEIALASYQVPSAIPPNAIPLSLDAALAQGVNANPDLIAVRGQSSVSRAAVGVAETYPWNPFVQAQYFPAGRPFLRSDEPGGAVGQSNYYVWAMQRFELAHQRKFRTESAQAALTQVEWNVQQAELNVLAQSMRLYFAAAYQKELRDLATETLTLHQTLADVVDRRFKANLAKAADATTARVAVRQSKRQAELAEATYQVALLALRQQLNLPMETPIAFPIKLDDYRWLAASNGADLSALANELVQARPDVQAAAAGIAVSEANHKLSRAARIPDVSAGPIYETGSDNTRFLGLRLQMEIPVWNNGTPLVRQRQAELGQQMLTREQLQVRASLEAQSSIDRFERARRLLAEARAEHSATPATIARDVQEITRQFQAGQADVLAVIAVQNALIQERRAMLDLLNEAGQSAAAVVQTTALPPNRIIANLQPIPAGHGTLP